MAVTGSGQVCWAMVAGASARMGSFWELTLPLFFFCWEAAASAGKETRGDPGTSFSTGLWIRVSEPADFVGEDSSLGLIITNPKAVCEVLLLLINVCKWQCNVM